MSRLDVQTNIRLPAELKVALQAAADASGRSFTTELVRRLLSTFEDLALSDSEASDLMDFKLRIPAGTKHQIELLAKANKRSMGAQIVFMLEAFLASQDANQ